MLVWHLRPAFGPSFGHASHQKVVWIDPVSNHAKKFLGLAMGSLDVHVYDFKSWN